MEIQALRRLEGSLVRLIDEHGRAVTRQEQLAAALAKSREELEKLKAQNMKYRTERAETRKRLDALIKRFDALGVEVEDREA